MHNAELNGAQIVPLEQSADVKLVDHARKNQAPGTHSYRYVELSIRNGQLEDLDAHRVSSVSRVDRPVGSVITASKGGKTKFTEEDDQLLWDLVAPFKEKGGAWRGNDIYKQVERICPRHTFQSWRDRWFRYTQFQNRQTTEQLQPVHAQGTDPTHDNPRPLKRVRIEDSNQTARRKANTSVVQERRPPPTLTSTNLQAMGHAQSAPAVERGSPETAEQQPLMRENDIRQRFEHHGSEPHGPTDNEQPDDTVPGNPGTHKNSKVLNSTEDSVAVNSDRLPLAFDFTQEEAHMLFSITPRILDAEPSTLAESWIGVARVYGHTVDKWQRFFYDVIAPEYKRRHGIRTEEELEAHNREYQEAAYKRKLKRSQQGNNVDTTFSPEKGQASDELHGFNQTDSADESSALQQNRNISETSAQSQENWEKHSRPLRSSDSRHRSPQPNESRKLSQSKASQSNSSQSQTNRHTHTIPVPQKLQNVQVSYVQPVQHVSQGSSQLNSSIQHPQSSLTHHSSPSRSAQLQKASLMNKGLEPLVISQSSSEGYSNQFVTQVSQNEELTPTDSSTDLEDIPFRALTPTVNPPTGSPLFVPAEPGQLATRSPVPSQFSDGLDLASSPVAVRLIEDDGVPSDLDHLSDYAPSEAPSEGVRFDSEVDLSQAWETAPDKVRFEEKSSDREEDKEDSNVPEHAHYSTPPEELESESMAQDDIAFVANGKSRSRTPEDGNSNDEHSSENGFEEAFKIRRSSQIIKNNHQTISLSASSKSVREPLDTQALFHQPTQGNLVEFAAFPEPPEGWNDEEEPPTSDAIAAKSRNNLHSADDVDWTLPLPDPDDELDNVPPSPFNESDGGNIDDWLTAQVEMYTSIPSLLLNPLSHRALESTSMDLDLAHAVLARMVQRYEKGKYPAHLSLDEIRKLRKKERKSAISKIVGELVPNDMAGCWTQHDDVALQSTNGKDVKRVEDKHGNERMFNRLEFLEKWNAM